MKAKVEPTQKYRVFLLFDCVLVVSALSSASVLTVPIVLDLKHCTDIAFAGVMKLDFIE